MAPLFVQYLVFSTTSSIIYDTDFLAPWRVPEMVPHMVPNMVSYLVSNAVSYFVRILEHTSDIYIL